MADISLFCPIVHIIVVNANLASENFLVIDLESCLEEAEGEEGNCRHVCDFSCEKLCIMKLLNDEFYEIASSLT